MIIGSIGSLATGVSFPLMFIFFGNIIDTGVGFNSKLNKCDLSVSNIQTKLTMVMSEQSSEFRVNATIIKNDFLNNISKQAVYLSSNYNFICLFKPVTIHM